MNWLHYHPDELVYVRNAQDAPLYVATREEFRSDYGAPFPPLPESASQLELFEGHVYLYDAKHNEVDAYHVDGTSFKAVLDALPQLLAARKARLKRSPEQELIPVTRA